MTLYPNGLVIFNRAKFEKPIRFGVFHRRRNGVMNGDYYRAVCMADQISVFFNR